MFRSTLRSPLLFIEILLASLLIALLNLAFPLFAIQLFNRYISHGYDGTLYTLTAGTLLALVLVHALRLVRSQLFVAIHHLQDFRLADHTLQRFLQIRSCVLDQLPAKTGLQVMRAVQTLQAVHQPANRASLFDFPFSLLYVMVIFLLNPLLGWITLGFIGLGLGLGLVQSLRTSRQNEQLHWLEQETRQHAQTAVASSKTLQLFNGQNWQLGRWRDSMQNAIIQHRKVSFLREQDQSSQLSQAMLLYIALYAVGAVLVVNGLLSIGALIGVNILASRAFQNVNRFVRYISLRFQEQEARRVLADFAKLPVQTSSGTALTRFSGRLQIVELTFHYPDSATPVFQQLHCEITPGELLLVCGQDGTGKTTLAQLLMGYMDPSAGCIEVDGITLQQISMSWWRQQIIFLPRHADLIEGSILENITLGRAEISQETVDQAVARSGLRRFIDQSAQGIHTPLVKTLTENTRKQLALARALVTEGSLVILDEPFEGLDTAGRKQMVQNIQYFLETGKSVVLMVQDPEPVGGRYHLLDLNTNTSPRLIADHGLVNTAGSRAR